MQENRQMLERCTDKLKFPVAAPKLLLAETVRWPLVALLAIRLAKAGCNVSAICPAHHPLLKTRAARQIFSYSGLRPLESLSTAIKVASPDFIIPCDERAVGHLHELHARACRMGAPGGDLAALIEKSIGPRESFSIVSSRYEFLKIAHQEGIRVPETRLLNDISDLASWQCQHAFPWVLKADGTFGGTGVRIVSSFNQAERCFLKLNRLFSVTQIIKPLCVNRDTFCWRSWWNGIRPTVVVQSFIRGRPANCAVVCWKGKVLAGIGVEVVSTVNPVGRADVVQLSDNADMRYAAERIARRLGLSGFFGLDFMIEDGTGLAHLIEMNPRPARPFHLQLGKGRDLVTALCSQLSGRPISDTPSVTQNRMIAYFPDAWDTKSEFLASSYHDIPEGEPDLVQELRQPWPTTTLLWRLMDRVEQLRIFLRKHGFRRTSEAENGSPLRGDRTLTHAKILD